MLVKDTTALTRLNSPNNLLNKLQEITTSRRSHTPTPIVSIPPPKADDLIDDLDEKLDNGSVKARAVSVMSKAIKRLDNNIETVDPKKLSNIVRDMAHAVKVLDPEKLDGDKTNIQFIIYRPEMKSENEFDRIVLSE